MGVDGAVPKHGTRGPNTRSVRPTLRDVARIAQVDPSLVSRVLNKDPRASASQETRERIVSAARMLDYQPSAVARGLRTARTSTLGLLLPNLSNPMYAELVAGVEDRARTCGFGVALGIHVDGSTEGTLLQVLRHTQVDGLLIASALLTDAYLTQVQEHAYGPVVFLNRRITGQVGSVVGDDAAGVALAVEHLADLGHQRVAGFFGPQFIDTSLRRQRGFESACRKRGIKAQSVVLENWTPQHGYQAAVEMLEAPSRPTAIFAATLELAMGVLRGARYVGCNVPEDVSVIGFDDHYTADYLHPRLTTISSPLFEMGAEAVDQLLAVIDGAEPQQIMIREGNTLFPRDSTGTAPNM